MGKKFFCLSLLFVCVLFSSCKSFEDYKEENAENAVVHFEKSRMKDFNPDKVVTLNECVVLAVENNLNLKIFDHQKDAAEAKEIADMLGMLPDLTINDTLTGRNQPHATFSKKITGPPSRPPYHYSQSLDNNLNIFNIDLAFSIIDFGLSWLNTSQAHDRKLIVEQQTRRAEQNLILKVVNLYLRVAVSQKSMKTVTDLLADCKNRYILIEEMSAAGKIDPFRALDEVKRFIEMEKKLTGIIRQYEISCFELRSIMGIYPYGHISVDHSILDSIPEFIFPEMMLMEQIALMNRPEMYEINMSRHVNILECRKAIVQMFPNAKIFMDFTNSNNSFLYHSSWMELGVRAAYNVLKIPQHIARYNASSDMADAETARYYAQSVAIMSQLRIAHTELMTIKEKLDIDIRVHKAYLRSLEMLEKQDNTEPFNQLKLAHLRLVTTESEINILTDVAGCYIAYFTILNAMGIENLHAESVDEMKTKLDAARVRAEKQLAKLAKEAMEQNSDSPLILPDFAKDMTATKTEEEAELKLIDKIFDEIEVPVPPPVVPSSEGKTKN